MKHYTFGGSTAARTIGCPAWVPRSANIPKKPSGSFAIGGSMLHEVMEQCRLEDLKPQDILDRGFTYKDQDGTELTFTDDHIELAEIAYNALDNLLDEYDIDAFDIEPFVEIEKDKIGGSIDYIGTSSDQKTVLIADYKFGKIAVAAKFNKQLMFYALAAMTDERTMDFFNMEKVKKIVLAIIQPKVKGVTSTCEIEMDDLLHFRVTYTAAVKEAESKNPRAEAGNHCKYCPFEPYCKERKAEAVQATLLRKEDKAELLDALARVDEVEAWAKAVKAEAHSNLERGVTLPGWKLVGKKAVNKWIDEAEAIKTLESIPGLDHSALHKVTSKFITGPQALTLIKKHNKTAETAVDISGLIAKIAPEGTTMAPADDDRDEIVVIKDTPDNLAKLLDKK